MNRETIVYRSISVFIVGVGAAMVTDNLLVSFGIVFIVVGVLLYGDTR